MDDSVHMTILTPQPSGPREEGGDDDEDARVWHTKMQLFDHQKTMIRAMSHIEQTHCVRSSRPHEDGLARRCIYTNVGINSDLTSAGKTLTVLSLIRSQSTPSRSKHIVHADSNHFYEVDETERTDVNINLIIVKHSLIPQWQQSLEQLTVNPAVRCDVVNKTQHLHDITPRVLRYVERATRDRVGDEDDDVIDEEGNREGDGNGDDEPRDRQWIILLSSTFVAQFVREVVNVQFRAVQLARIVVDEPHTLTISASFPFNANFIWFLCATPMQFITSGRTYLRRVFGNLHARTAYERVLKLCLRNEDEFVYQSLNLPPIEYNHIRCIGSRVVESIRSYIPSTALRHLNAGDTDGAIRSLRCNTGTESSVLSSLTHYYNRELMNFEARKRFYEEQRMILVNNTPPGAAQETLHIQRLRRVDEILATLNTNIKERTDTITAIRERATGDCVICYEENLAERSICPHCNNVYCLACIIRSLQQQSTCPMCRHALRPEELLTVVPDNMSSAVTDPSSSSSALQNKEDALQSILREAREDQRFLIFSEYDATFQTLSNALGERFEYTILKGPSNHIQRKLRMFRSGAVPIIMLNGAHFGSGMDLSAATDIIIYHELTSPGLLKQVIGRAQRIGRSTSLRVTRLLYDGERIEQ